MRKLNPTLSLIYLFFLIFSTSLIVKSGTTHINSGLVASFPFNNNANDESGNANKLSVQGATITADRFDNPNSTDEFDRIKEPDKRRHQLLIATLINH